ncbi:MAG: OmpP1/FadL family transporter [Thiohalospira sp.]
MKKLIIFVITLLSFNITLIAQSPYVDYALKFSTNNYSGTARFAGMSGAFGALGGDFSSLAINPGGLGVFRNTELLFSPGVSYNQTSSAYINTVTDDNSYQFGINNLGLVVSYDLEDADTRWVNVNFAVGYNKLNNYNQNILFSGNNNLSIMEYFVDNANSAGSINNLDGMYERLLYNIYLMDYDSINNEFWSQVTDQKWYIDSTNSFNMNKQKIIQNDGSAGEFTFAIGANYAHKLYVGVNIGISSIRYSELSSHYEYENEETDIYDYSAMEFQERSNTSGTGFSLKLGAIYKPVEFLRLGAAFHLPTFYKLEEDFYTRAEAYFDNGDFLSQRSVTQTYEYELTTPWKAIGSVGVQIGKFALIDADYEYVDYSTMKMDDDFKSQGVIDDNNYINSNFIKTHNVRFGAEFRTGTFYYRGGFAYSTSPFKEGTSNESFDRTSYSAGLGYRESNFYIDFAYRRTMSEFNIVDYPGGTQANIDNTMNNFILTAGVKF